MQHTKDFSKATIGSLKTQGIRIIGSTIVPHNGSTIEGQVVYNLDLRGTHYVRTHAQVLELANNPHAKLEVK